MYYITSEQAKSIHKITVEISGGGITDAIHFGQLESVLQNIQNDEYYPAFIDKLTHLFYCTCQFHCFADGNKRLALSLSTQFLLLNGYLKIASRFIVIFESYFNGTFESEEMKLKIYEAISENSLVEV